MKSDFSRSGYTFHFGVKLAPHLDYLNEVCERHGTTRAGVIESIMLHVLGTRMLDAILAQRPPRHRASRRDPERRVQPANQVTLPSLPYNPAVYDPPVDDVIIGASARTDLPPVLPRTPMPTSAALRPKYAQHHGIPQSVFQHREPEKSKDRMREELRRAVENTR